MCYELKYTNKNGEVRTEEFKIQSSAMDFAKEVKALKGEVHYIKAREVK